jgi:hypothetical protein
MQIEMFDLPDAKISLKMQCEDCGYIQIVKGSRLGGYNYFGSAYNWCDECDSGLPVAIEDIKVENETI